MKPKTKQILKILVAVMVCLSVAWHLGTRPSTTVVYTPGQLETTTAESSTPEEVPKVEAAPKLEETPKVEDEANPEEPPKIEEMPKVQETQKVEEEPKPQEVPKAEEKPKPQEVPKIEEKPKLQEVPKAEEGANNEDTDKTDTTRDPERLEEAKDDKKAAQELKKEIIDNQSSTKKDKYLTDPTPEGKPKPIEPDDSIIFPLQEVTVYEGESVFDVLLREVQNAGIHMEFEFTPMYNSAYIEGINNLYEFDVGELSGWMYKVNEWFPNYGCSRYQLKEGDIIEWVYTCDLGRDVGDVYIPPS